MYGNIDVPAQTLVIRPISALVRCNTLASVWVVSDSFYRFPDRA